MSISVSVSGLRSLFVCFLELVGRLRGCLCVGGNAEADVEVFDFFLALDTRLVPLVAILVLVVPNGMEEPPY